MEGRAVTVISHVAVFSPAFAVMTVFPAATAETVPSFTVATSVLEEVQVMILSSVLSGSTVAFRVTASPTCISWVSLSNVTDSTGIPVTVIRQVADF